MQIKNHGEWTPYKPNPFPKEAPPNALFCSNQSGVDWYDYSRKNFTDPNSIKMTVMLMKDGNGVIMAANKDVSFLFPQHLTVIEVFGLQSDDPQKDFGRKIYHSANGTFSDDPMPPINLPQTTFGPPEDVVFTPPPLPPEKIVEENLEGFGPSSNVNVVKF